MRFIALNKSSRAYSSISLIKPKNSLFANKNSLTDDITKSHVAPARTRFAPSPTGKIHLGSLRTALYNYLWAKHTNGQFILRLEDTDQNRLVPGAEQNIYDSLRWVGLDWDEGPSDKNELPYGPYKQSLRGDIYKIHADKLLASGHAYRCFCSKERLTLLTESARKLHPPSLASYDRKCLHHFSEEESDHMARTKEGFTIRLKSPMRYPKFNDLLHGEVDFQVQVNPNDMRYDDPILVKSDGLPTYHFANVVDDHLMRITHVIRGEEWLGSTPKHLEMYNAFGWEPPQFVHIPLLTSASNQKLSKRMGDSGILEMASQSHILPEAMINFVALLGWAPPREGSLGTTTSEILTLDMLTEKFSLQGLTKGNTKVDFKKLHFFNAHYLHQRLRRHDSEAIDKIQSLLSAEIEAVEEKRKDVPVERINSRDYLYKVADLGGPSIASTAEFVPKLGYFFFSPSVDISTATVDLETMATVLQYASDCLQNENAPTMKTICDELAAKFSKPVAFKSLRLALTGSESGVSVPVVMETLGTPICINRINNTVHNMPAI